MEGPNSDDLPYRLDYERKVVPVRAMNPLGRVQVRHHPFLTSELDGGEWPAVKPGVSVKAERAVSTH